MNTASLKGKACPYRKTTCQEGFCQDCQIYLDYLSFEDPLVGKASEQRTISSSIYPIDSLRKQIAVKRNEAFNETCYGSREHKLEASARVGAYDVVLGLIDKGGK